MALPRFTFTSRARPFLEVGIGDSRVPTGQARWGVARWDADTALWAGTEPTFLDVSCEAFTARCEYGRRRSTDRFVVGVANIVVHNATGWADPNVSADPLQLAMRPGRAVRFGVDHVVLGRVVLWRGFIDAMTPSYDPTQPDTVELACIDALGEVNRAKLAAADDMRGEGENVTDRVAYLLTAATWPDSKRLLDPVSTALVAYAANGQAADLLGQASDSGGCSIFGDRSANVVLRGRDWQTFVPGTPYEATIGNVGKGEPGYTVPAVPGYLTPTVGTVSTPDTGWSGAAPWEMTFRLRSNVALPAATDRWIAGQWTGAATVQKWFLGARAGASGLVFGIYNNAGVRLDYQVATPAQVTALFQPGVDVWLRVRLTATAGTGYASTDGVTWTTLRSNPASYSGPRSSSSALAIGVHSGTANVWDGRIWFAYASSLDAQMTPTATLWRFDANDYPGTGTSYVDPRGRTWTLTSPTAITPKVPEIVVPPVPADVCPVSWDRPYARADITTVAIMGRDPDTAVVRVDDAGRAMFGDEPFERVDLWTASDADLTMLADRVLRVRSYATAPVVRAVRLDARTSDDALDLMASADPYKPTHYRCRLGYPNRLVFDDVHFVTGIVHELTPTSWSADINLDLAAPYEAAGGRWDGAYWDLATWAAAGT